MWYESGQETPKRTSIYRKFHRDQAITEAAKRQSGPTGNLVIERMHFRTDKGKEHRRSKFEYLQMTFSNS